MIPWGPIAMLVGAVVNHACAPSTKPPPTRSPVSPESSFQAHMQELSQQSGIPPLSIKSDLAKFEPVFQGRHFATAVLKKGETIYIGMASNRQFQRGRIPADIRAKLGVLATPADGFRLTTADDPDCSYVMAEAIGPADGLSPAMFSHLIQRMMLSLSILDAYIEQEGCAN